MGWLTLVLMPVPAILWGLAMATFGWSEGDSVWVLVVGYVVLLLIIARVNRWLFHRHAKALYEKDLAAHVEPSSSD